jgi:hypothetical protein
VLYRLNDHVSQITFTGKTGIGSGQINGGSSVTCIGIQFDITALGAGRYRELDAAAPKRIQYAGSVGLGFTSGGVITIRRSLHIGFEHQLFPNLSDAVDTLYWWLSPGITATLIAYW